MKINSLKCFVVIIIASLIFSIEAWSQSSSSLMLEEVTVTATKREENLQDVGVSVTAFNEQQVRELALETMGEIANFAPGVEYKRLWGAKGNNSLFFIRGLGQADFNEGSESPANVYVDDFYIISNSAVDFLMHDVRGVEILRGPQGTLFGRNSTAGAVNIRNNPPEHEFAGDILLNFGNYNRRETVGMVNIPIIAGKLATRFAFDMDRNDAHTKNLFTGGGPGATDNHEGDFESFRWSTLWEPTESLSLLYRFQHGRVDAITTGDNSIPLTAGVGEVVEAPFDAFGYNENLVAPGAGQLFTDGTNGLTNDIYLHVLSGTWQYNENASLTSITGYFDQSKQTFEECDGSPRTQCGLRQRTVQDYWTQEFRLNIDTDSSRWTFGLYYLDQDYENFWQALLLSGSGTNEALGFAPNTPGGLISVTPNTLDVKAYAAYANWAHDLNEELTVTVGVRVNREEKDFIQDEGLFIHDYADTGQVTVLGQTFGFVALDDDGFDDLLANHIIGEADPNIHFEDRYTDTFPNYKIQLDWNASDSLLLFASYRHGAKAGGFNNGFTNYTPSNLHLIQFDKEVADSFEIGSKWGFWDGRGRLNSSVFYTDITDYQASAFIGGNTSVGTFVLNRDARTAGFEIELTVNPVDGLDLQLAAGYIDTNVEDITNSGGGVSITKDRELGHAPRWQSNGLIRYEWPVHTIGRMIAQANYSWIDSRFVDVLNDPGTELKSYAEGNASLTLQSNDDSWSIGVYVKNIADTRPVIQRFNLVGLGGAGQANYLPPRRYGVMMNYRW